MTPTRPDQLATANHPGPSPLQRDGCPKIINLGSAKTDLFYERKKYGCALVPLRPAISECSFAPCCAAVAAFSVLRDAPVKITAPLLPPSPAGPRLPSAAHQASVAASSRQHWTSHSVHAVLALIQLTSPSPLTFADLRSEYEERPRHVTLMQEQAWPALSAALRPLPPFLATSLACCTALLMSLEFSPPCLRSTLILLCPSLAL